MLHKAWNNKGEMPYCFPRSSIKFQGHTWQNITDFDPYWAFPDYRPVAAFKSVRFALFLERIDCISCIRGQLQHPFGQVMGCLLSSSLSHDDVIKWKYFPCYWPFVWGEPVTGEFPSQKPVTRSFDVFFDLRFNKRKQSKRWWFETPSLPLWSHCNDFPGIGDRSRALWLAYGHRDGVAGHARGCHRETWLRQQE